MRSGFAEPFSAGTTGGFAAPCDPGWHGGPGIRGGVNTPGRCGMDAGSGTSAGLRTHGSPTGFVAPAGTPLLGVHAESNAGRPNSRELTAACSGDCPTHKKLSGNITSATANTEAIA